MGLGIYFVYLPKIKDMENNCKKCGTLYKVRPSKAEKSKYCSKECASKKVTKPCDECGKPVTRVQSQMLKKVFCGRACSKIGTGKYMTQMNKDLNPDRMNLETRTKLRAAHVGKGEGKAYRKTFGVHTHRIVAAEKIGRPLKKGEVVHHIDGNILNNHPDNLEVLPSQAEHARLHAYQNNKRNKKC